MEEESKHQDAKKIYIPLNHIMVAIRNNSIQMIEEVISPSLCQKPKVATFWKAHIQCGETSK